MSDYGDDFAESEDGSPETNSPIPTPTQPTSPPPSVVSNANGNPSSSSNGASNGTPININSLESRIARLEQNLTSANTKNASLTKELKKTKALLSKKEAEINGSEDLGKELYEMSERLVKEGGKNVRVTTKLEATNQKLVNLQHEVGQFRGLLLEGICGGVVDTENYANVGLGDLLRLRLKEADNNNGRGDGAAKTAPGMSSTLPRAPPVAGIPKDEDEAGADAGADETNADIVGIQKLEREISEKTKKMARTQSRYESVEAELQSALEECEVLHDVRQKNAVLVERVKHEKELRARAENNLKISNKKVSALSDHIEKLMLHLKHEATSKAKSLDEKAKANREVEMLRGRNAAIMKKNNGRERVISELKEGAKILEDQLRLMDEKYMELRTKLDWTRLTSERTVKKKEEECRSLRQKFALMQGSFSGGVLLDSIEIGPDGKLKEPPSTGKKKRGGMKNSSSSNRVGL